MTLNPNLQQAGIELAKITPKEDFTQMFYTIHDYSYNGKFSGRDICEECLFDIKKGTENEQPNVNLRAEDKPKCNCRTLCDFYETFYGGETTSECEQRDCNCGCGFLWLFKCTKNWSDN